MNLKKFVLVHTPYYTGCTKRSTGIFLVVTIKATANVKYFVNVHTCSILQGSKHEKFVAGIFTQSDLYG
jgi:hypothetical protein